jgi:hypothetical protein
LSQRLSGFCGSSARLVGLEAEEISGFSKEIENNGLKM